MDLFENNLSGQIAKQIMGLSSLSLGLYLNNNQFTGSIPIEVGKFVNLFALKLYENKLSGEIP